MAEPAAFRPTALLQRLGRADIEYVVIGGIAMTLHGSDRTTFDLDICPDQSSENLEKLGAVLIELDATLRGIDEPAPFVPDRRSLAQIQILTLDTSLGPLDVLGRPDGSPPFARLFEHATVVQLGEVTVRVASIDDLLTMKRSAGRTKDEGDVETLETMLRLRRERR